jgi:isopenicillin-N epimerase
LPLDNAAQFVERFWSQVSERTRWIFLSHITSPTALTFPVEQICARARQEGIPTIIDGAHAPGQIGLDLSTLDADIYAGACHKWLCAPKGAAFLYVRRDLQPALDPLVVSWGYESEHPGDSRYVDYHEWQGTRDLAAFLSVPAAIEFQQRHDWEIVRSRCHSLAVQTRRRFEQVSGLPSICAEDQFQQMFTVRLPAAVDLDRLKAELYDHFKIEVPTISWNAEKFLRISIQVYNDEADADHLIQSIRSIL